MREDSMNTSLSRRFSIGAFALTMLSGLATARPAAAEEVGAEAKVTTADLGGSEADDSAAVLLAGKVGGIASFNGLAPFVIGGIEAGYIFGGLDRSLGVELAVEYTAPKTDGSGEETLMPARIPGGSYDWTLTQKILTFQPTFFFRFVWLSKTFTPYVGIGPRIYLLESSITGEVDGQELEPTTERSTKLGFGVPVGAEIAAGPGAFF